MSAAEETMKAALEQIATGRVTGGRPADHWVVCRDIAEKALTEVYGPRPEGASR